ncbi:iron complex outermembrane recepter protein [Hydrocarboniphaga daqingensis]|uniref:Iron complex outermembrane recepter protein n=1 Tax=Hydrocarboniphaga daqingensis TaxID=490188 RepID=A0A1M5QER1_9GAMM|nr:TonB-dependent receptor [Hydrocarboniphaga daqingensis]SHH12340.1 iron complex outermembrane recepter protein [Hydrocarboniphaga daqingensis]
MKRITHLGLALAGSLSLPALAQTDAPSTTRTVTDTPTAAAETIEEVVVTAQRREEKLQDVPLAVTAFSPDQLQSRGIEDVTDLSALAPGLRIAKTPSNNTISQISIRGVTQINPAIYWDPAVGIYVDGVYIGKAQGSVFDVVDLTAVEVLRGPQGTLYGRNTLAGAINLRTRAPSGVFGGSANVEVGNYNSLVQKANLDLPQWGIARVSVGVRSERRDGWVKTERTSAVSELNNRNNDAFRVAADFDFSDRFKAEYRFDASNVNQTNNFDQLYRLEPTGIFAPATDTTPAGFLADFFPVLAGFASQDRQTRADVDAPSFEVSRISGHALTLSYQLDEHNTIKSITGYRRLEWNDSLDLDGSPNDVVFTQRFTDYDQTSQDLQLLGSRGSLTYVAGVYYFADDGNTDNPQRFFFGNALFDSRYATKTDAWAGYGQVDYKPVDALTLSAGIRYTREKKELSRVFGVSASAADPFFYFIPEGTQASRTFDATTPMLSVAYKLTPQVNLYARYAEGFKSGGFNGEYSNTAPPADRPNINIDETRTPFKPERQKSFEVGSKSTLFDGRALLNVALFHNELTDLQQSTFLGGAESAAGSVIRNAGEATVYGAELEATVVLMPGTRLSGNYAYLHPEFDRFDDGGVNQADNRAFVHAPKHTFNVLLDSTVYRAAWGNVRGLIDYAYTDSIFTYPYQLDGSNPNAQLAANSQVKAYGLLNARIGVGDVKLSESATGDLFLWVRNLADEDTASNFIDFGPGFGNLAVANFVEPRTYGLSLSVRW